MDSTYSKYLKTLAVIAAFSSSGPALALSSISPTDLSAMTSDAVSSLVQTVGVVADHRAYMPATALGVLLGLDIGFDATYLPLPSSFATALSVASGQSSATLPAGLLLPKLNIHKGLPFGIDLGATFMTLSAGGEKVFTSYGGEAKWTFVRSMAAPALAVRASYASNKVYFLETGTFTMDLLASKNLVLIDPFVGAGFQRWSGSIEVPLSIPQLPSSVSAEASGTNFHVYGGLMLKLAILKLVAQVEYSTAGFTTYGGKLSFGF